MTNILHITSGDIAGASLAKTEIPGEVFIWHDILYDGPRNPGWPTEETLNARSLFLETTTAGGLSKQYVLKTLRDQYQQLKVAFYYDRIILWFDACLFDQSMLAHILTCLRDKGINNVELLCVDSYPGIFPFHGIGQLLPEHFASLYEHALPVSEEQFSFATHVDKAFATQNLTTLTQLSSMTDAPLPWIPAAVMRWLQEQPAPNDGLGKLERLAIQAIREGNHIPRQIYEYVAAADTPPQYWGDTTLWAKINGLANRMHPLIRIEGPAAKLPQWESELKLQDFTISVL